MGMAFGVKNFKQPCYWLKLKRYYGGIGSIIFVLHNNNWIYCKIYIYTPSSKQSTLTQGHLELSSGQVFFVQLGNLTKLLKSMLWLETDLIQHLSLNVTVKSKLSLSHFP